MSYAGLGLLLARAAFADVESLSSLCARPNYVDLRIDLYDGNVRDEDVHSDSDAYCLLTVANVTQMSAVVLETENPTFEEFFMFGCTEVDAFVDLTCFDWDPDFLVYNPDELVFHTSVLHWPVEGVKARWYDSYDPQYWVDVDFTYSVPDPSPAPTSAAPTPTTGPTSIPAAATAAAAAADDDDGAASASAMFVFVAGLFLFGGIFSGSVIAYRLRQKEDIIAEATEVGGVELAEVVAVTAVDAAGIADAAGGRVPIGTAKSMV